MEEDIMELRARFLHRQVKIVDGSTDEDGEYGLVIGVTARSAEAITVFFYAIGTMRHVNFYGPEDLELVPGTFVKGQPRDSVLRCHRSRFDALWRIFDQTGSHGAGSGTQGGAWAQYLAEVRQTSEKEKNNGEEVGVDASDEMADATPQINHVVSAADGCQLRDGLGLGKGLEQSDVAECNETQSTDGAEVGGLDQEVGEARVD
jgi:hypothetical protein